ncbi:SDR family oxidoreductase [Aquamicrobium sp. LC103]|uniref:SDR family NAD(P)-dependent oxidoreductase n=1 Tax=Aquamicrobium sp. LC103 TaxID=1120658 RepID=UPI00063EA1A5|nr:SDR family oxidoreductase [Aquamicrobium sp. LC103]TKT81074.1 SDR family oxidoreductase [Aquamicrobium sp. LC103]
MNTPLPLAGRRALVTGADSDIGAAIARGLARQGVDLILHHFAGAETASRLADELRATGRGAALVQQDFLDAGSVGPFARRLLSGADAIDILVHCAAIERRRPWAETPPGHVEQHMAVNVAAFLSLASTLVPPMAERGWGRVVAIGSVMAARPRAETVAYAATKAALFTAVRALARDVARHGVTMNVVSPGAIETARMAERYADPDFRAAVTAKIPAARPGLPADIAGPVAFLCSNEAAYVTGINLPVDGGWTIGDAPGVLPGETK